MTLRFIAIFFSFFLLGVMNVNAASPSWNRVDLTYKSYSYEEMDDFSPSGFNISATYLLASKLFITSQSETVTYQYPAPRKDTTFELSVISFGMGLKHSIANSTDIWLGAGIASLETEVSDKIFINKEKSDGFYSEVGIRSMLSRKIELWGRCQRRTIEVLDGENKSNEYFTFGSRYLLNRSVSLISSFGTGQDHSNTTSIGLSVKF
jgi:hypothetical protein